MSQDNSFEEQVAKYSEDLSNSMKYSMGIDYKTYKKIFWVYMTVYAFSIMFAILAFFINHLPPIDSKIFKYLIQFLGIVLGLSITALFYHVKKTEDEKAEFLDAHYDMMEIFKEKYLPLIDTTNTDQEFEDIIKKDTSLNLLPSDVLDNLREKSKERENSSKSSSDIFGELKYHSKSIRDMMIKEYYNKYNELVIKWWIYILVSYIIAIFVSVLALASHELNLERFQLTFLFLAITLIIVSLYSSNKIWSGVNFSVIICSSNKF